ncbi:uncharacterized protein LOC107606819 [Arachis ipaensis]|uniref:uncharacterized protein LOC107606819 n=1 Tax=Arachis ipaensis TaxID=130454 RepID=UPI0007AF07B4|nr:uncharacterized protein LOC107606819 [Arachis ipaensis]
MALVKWEVIQAPKRLGGLGVGDAVVCNTALLFKWWWQFSKEECPLWKKVVYSCNNLNPNDLLSSQSLPIRGVLQVDMAPEDISSYSFTRSIWKGLVPPRVELFVWFGLTGRVNTKERLCRFGAINQEDSLCVLCKMGDENVHHLFLGCNFSWQVWGAWISHVGLHWIYPGTVKEHFQSWTEFSSNKEERKRWMVCFCAIMWNIWLERNRRIFQNKEKGAQEVISLAVQSYTEWLGADPFSC